MKTQIFSAIALLSAAITPATAFEFGKNSDRFEFKLGGALYDTGPLTFHDTNGGVLNMEFLFKAPEVLQRLGSPRPYVGAEFSFVEKGAKPVHVIYGGLNWQAHWTSRFYTSGSLGGSVNNADLSSGSRNWGLGSNILFHVGVAAGFEVTENLTAEVYLNHFSNAFLGYSNAGHESVGMRLGYKYQ